MQKPIATVEGIVEFLTARGNSVITGGVQIDPGGHHYALSKPIDFSSLDDHFAFPEHIKAAREHDEILDTSTWVSIYGARGYAAFRQKQA